jgi:hypothetical protein
MLEALLRPYFPASQSTKIAHGQDGFCLHISVMYHSGRTHFTLSPADDLMDFLAGGFSPNVSTCLVMPAPLANERKKAYD